MKYCGRGFTGLGLAEIRRIAEEEPGRTRWAISLLVCEALSWRKLDGGLKQMSCRVALLRTQADGLLRLPPAQHGDSNGRRYLRPTPGAESQPPICEPAGQLHDLQSKLVSAGPESLLWNEYVERCHDLGYQELPGAQLRHSAQTQEKIVPLLGFGAAAWKTPPRDVFIGWTPAHRERRLHLAANNTRVLILPRVSSRHLASKLLGMPARLLPQDRQHRYGYRPLLRETFVEKRRFGGTCYKAATWLCVGDTQGWRKLDTTPQRALPLKSVWVYPHLSPLPPPPRPVAPPPQRTDRPPRQFPGCTSARPFLLRFSARLHTS